MRTRYPSHDSSAGISVLTVAFLAGASLLVLGAVLSWSTSNTRFTQRQNQYLGSLTAAEAAAEKVITQISRDFQASSEPTVYNNLSSYRLLLPTGDSVWSRFEFSNAQGNNGQLYVDRIASWSYTPLQTRLTNVNGNAATYRIIANARELNTPYNSIAALQQDVQLASIPVFQYQIFYALDLELGPGANMTITGPVHCNASAYFEPSGNLTFQAPVTASRQIVHDNSPNDPLVRTFGSVTYNAGRDMRVNTLNLPLGTSNSSSVLHGLIEIPPAGESTNSLMGMQRYYYKADLIVLVSNNTVVAKSGAYNNFSVSIPWTNINPFLNTNASFFNKRANQTVKATEINIGDFINQYTTLTTLLGRNPKVLYVADLRTQSAGTVSGVRLINGQTLPSAGLTVATFNPLYVKGHYNAPSGALGTTNTSGTVPASLVTDGITILSGNWADSNSTDDLTVRLASSTTVNAGVIAGIVPSGGGYYSGGAENFWRLLENWSGDTFTFNGSMVALFPSQIATAPWGATSDVYNPPTRKLSLDWNFKNPAKLPPGTPELRTLIRSQWAMIRPNTI